MTRNLGRAVCAGLMMLLIAFETSAAQREIEVRAK